MIGSLFSGIGGLELGLERAGLGPVAWQAEIDPFCRRVLRAHWPDAHLFGSAQEVKRDTARPVRVVCGGFPCQPVSYAGKRLGADDERWLWPECRRVLEELQPEWGVFENVPGLRTKGLDEVLRDIASLGLNAEWCDLRASDVGAPQIRARLFIVTHRDGTALDRFRAALECAMADRGILARVADAKRRGLQRKRGSVDVARAEGAPCDEGRGRDAGEPAARGGGEVVADAHGLGRGAQRAPRLHDHGSPRYDAPGCGAGAFPPRPGDVDGWRAWLAGGGPRPLLRRGLDGDPDWVDRVASLGNAVVPMVAEMVGRAIVAA